MISPRGPLILTVGWGLSLDPEILGGGGMTSNVTSEGIMSGLEPTLDSQGEVVVKVLGFTGILMAGVRSVGICTYRRRAWASIV